MVIERWDRVLRLLPRRRYALFIVEMMERDRAASDVGAKVRPPTGSELAQEIRRNIRRDDLVAETGPQRFLILAWDIDTPELGILARRLSGVVQGITGGARLEIGCSTGRDVSLHEVCTRAQKALARNRATRTFAGTMVASGVEPHGGPWRAGS